MRQGYGQSVLHVEKKLDWDKLQSLDIVLRFINMLISLNWDQTTFANSWVSRLFHK